MITIDEILYQNTIVKAATPPSNNIPEQAIEIKNPERKNPL